VIGAPKDLAAGLLFVGFGAVAIVAGSDYPMGTAARMGPGYFPRILGGLLVALGAAIALGALRPNGTPIAFGSPMPAAIVLAAVVLFGVAAPLLGLVAAAFLVVAISARASSEYRMKESLISGAVLAAAAAAIFVYGLGLQLAPWPPALSGL